MDKRVKAFKHSQFTSSLLVFGNMWVCGAGGTPDRELYGGRGQQRLSKQAASETSRNPAASLL